MKIKDLKEGQFITSPTKGEGMILKITFRTITTRFRCSTSKFTLNTAGADIKYSDL